MPEAFYPGLTPFFFVVGDIGQVTPTAKISYLQYTINVYWIKASYKPNKLVWEKKSMIEAIPTSEVFFKIKLSIFSIL